MTTNVLNHADSYSCHTATTVVCHSERSEESPYSAPDPWRQRAASAMRRMVFFRLRQSHGAAMIEFALLTTVFVMILLGVVEMARMVLVYTSIANAARAGARYAIVHGADAGGTGVDGPSGPGNPCTCTQVQTVVTDFTTGALLNKSNLTINVTYPDGSNQPGSRVLVTVTYPYDPFVNYFNTMLGVTIGSSSEGVITF